MSREELGREVGPEEDIACDRRHMEFCPLRSPWPLGVCPSLPGLGLGQYDSPHSCLWCPLDIHCVIGQVGLLSPPDRSLSGPVDSSQISRGELWQSHHQPSKDPCQTQGSSLPGSPVTSGALTFLHPQLFSHRRKVSLTWLPILPLSLLGVREQASRSPVRSSLPSAVKLDWAAPPPTRAADNDRCRSNNKQHQS